VSYSGAVRRTPLILALVAVMAGVGMIVIVLFTHNAAPAHNTAFTPGTSAITLPPSDSGSPTNLGPSPGVQKSPVPQRTLLGKGTPYKFPVAGKASYAHTHHDYPASDIMAACGTPVVSPVNGVVLEVSLVDTWTAKVNAGATRGGLSWSILGDDGVRYYGSHMQSIDALVRAGKRVTAGQRLGKVGETGDAGACHLHFGLSPLCQKTGDWWIRRGVIYPWSYLDAWKAGTRKVPLDAVNAWQAKNGCPKKPLVDP
jgi:murein DD-endopeptidase MepM/ murein hydrolase activator NlpD